MHPFRGNSLSEESLFNAFFCEAEASKNLDINFFAQKNRKKKHLFDAGYMGQLFPFLGRAYDGLEKEIHCCLLLSTRANEELRGIQKRGQSNEN